MKKVKIIVVGCGNIGKRHIAILIEQNQFELIAICDINQLVLSDLQQLYSKTFSIYSDYQKMLNEVNADVVAICTPHYLHCKMSVKALKLGFDVLCEKPMAMNSSECETMNQAAYKAKKKLWIVHQNRYNIPIKYTKKAIDEGRLGQVFMIQCNVIWNRNEEYYSKSNWRGKKETEGGALHTQASHFIDLITWWFGDVVTASTQIETKNHTIEIEDCGIANLQFESGVIGSLFWTTNAYPSNFEGSITIIAEKGTIKIGGKYLNKLDYWEVEGFALPADIDFSDKPNTYDKYKGSSSNHDKLYAEIQNYYNGISFNLVNGIEAITTSKAIEMIYENR